MILHSEEKGMTLPELMVTVGIVSLLSAVAIPNLVRTRLNANEKAAIASMRQIFHGLESFTAGQSPASYPGSGVTSGGTAVEGLAQMDDTTPAYIDPVLASGIKQGYAFTYTPGEVRVLTLDGTDFNVYDTFTLTGDPISPGNSGNRGFFLDQTGIVRVSETPPAGPSDPPLE
jgi:prepilin-type N-terminal cleavage/methylation domain-containing protein